MPSKTSKLDEIISTFIYRARCGDNEYVIDNLNNITIIPALSAAEYSVNLDDDTKGKIRARIEQLNSLPK